MNTRLSSIILLTAMSAVSLANAGIRDICGSYVRNVTPLNLCKNPTVGNGVAFALTAGISGLVVYAAYKALTHPKRTFKQACTLGSSIWYCIRHPRMACKAGLSSLKNKWTKKPQVSDPLNPNVVPASSTPTPAQ